MGVAEENVAGPGFGAVADVLEVARDPLGDAAGGVVEPTEAIVDSRRDRGGIDGVAHGPGAKPVVLAPLAVSRESFTGAVAVCDIPVQENGVSVAEEPGVP